MLSPVFRVTSQAQIIIAELDTDPLDVSAMWRVAWRKVRGGIPRSLYCVAQSASTGTLRDGITFWVGTWLAHLTPVMGKVDTPAHSATAAAVPPTPSCLQNPQPQAGPTQQSGGTL